MLTADLDDVPGSVWAAPSPAPVYTAREWLAASRWPGDGMRYLLAGGLMVPVRLVTDPAAWSRMNLVDICAGTAFGDWADPGVVARARSEAVPHLLVAAPGYFTVPIGPADGDVSALVDAVEGQGLEGHGLEGHGLEGHGLEEQRLVTGFGYLPPEAAPLLAELRRRGYATGVISVTTRLDLPGDSFDDYLGRPERPPPGPGTPTKSAASPSRHAERSTMPAAAASSSSCRSSPGWRTPCSGRTATDAWPATSLYLALELAVCWPTCSAHRCTC